MPERLLASSREPKACRFESFARSQISSLRVISAFGGLSANSLFYNTTLGIAMLAGRFFFIIPAMAIAGSLVAKKKASASAGTFPTDGGLFVGLLVGVILIVGGLTFFPALALGPVVEHLAVNAGQTFSSN